MVLAVFILVAAGSLGPMPAAPSSSQAVAIDHAHTCEILGEHDRAVHIDRAWAGGVVPYRFDGAVIEANRVRTREVMDEIESWSGVRFVAYTGSEPNWVTIRNSPPGSGNSATLGQRPNGVVNIVLWESKGMILHELMHTLGFLHEQSRADRDQYLEMSGCAASNGNYSISPNALMIGPYDFDSVTHYTPLWGCASGQAAFSIKEPYFSHYQSSVGTWHFNYRGPSNGDIWGLYSLYGGDPTPGPFRYLSPANDGVVGGGGAVELAWQPAPLADGYRVQVDRSPIFRFPLRTVETQDASVGIDGLSPGRYFWRTAALNHRGETFPWPKPNDIWSFVVTCGVADTAEPYGVVDATDVSAFVALFVGRDASADLNADGMLNFFDVGVFLDAFARGCP